MMYKTLFSFSIFLQYLIQFCFSNNVKTFENQTTSQNPLSFSFEKESYRNFQCYFDNRILSHKSIYNPPFYYNKAVKNFFTIFGLIFQYSLIKNDESFKEVIKNLFICYQKKMQNLRQNIDEFEYYPKKFNDHLNKLNKLILSITEGKLNDVVTVKEINNRIIITQNDSSIDFTVKLFDIIKKDSINVSINEEYANVIIESQTLFNEMYLKDLEQKSFVDFHLEVHKEYEKRGESECLTIEPSEDAFENLLRSYARLKQIEKEHNKAVEVENKENDIERLNEIATLHGKMYRSGKFTKYLNDLISKMNAKLLFEVYENPFNLDSFFIDPREGFKDYMLSLIHMLQESLSDTRKIIYVNTVLTEESFNNLLKNCLELSL